MASDVQYCRSVEVAAAVEARFLKLTGAVQRKARGFGMRGAADAMPCTGTDVLALRSRYAVA
jgi:hypothetical protein